MELNYKIGTYQLIEEFLQAIMTLSLLMKQQKIH